MKAIKCLCWFETFSQDEKLDIEYLDELFIETWFDQIYNGMEDFKLGNAYPLSKTGGLVVL